jgi:hypothetical protein
MSRSPTHTCRLLILALVSPALTRIPAQMNMSSHVMEMQYEIPPERLPPPVAIAGIGNAHHLDTRGSGLV